MGKSVKSRAVSGDHSGAFYALISCVTLLAAAFVHAGSFASAPSVAGASATENHFRASTTGKGRQLDARFFQLTGTHLVQGQTEQTLQELPDPAPPFITAQGKVQIYGSAPYFIQYKNWNEFENGGSFQVVPMTLKFPSGAAIQGVYTHPWDLRKYWVSGAGGTGKEILVGGAMSPSAGRPIAVWPDDNINRRIFMFRLDDLGAWVRDVFPIAGKVAQEWTGHSYGGNFFQPGQSDLNTINPNGGNPIYFFFEKVSEDRRGPYKTEIFVKKVDSLAPPSSSAFRSGRSTPGGEETKLIGVGTPPRPSTQRTVGGYLVEGPRPIQMDIQGQRFYIIAFSSGDFPTDSYTLNYAWSRNVTGPYQTVMNRDGTDFLDLGLEIKAKYNLSWVGRPSFFRTPSGNYEMLFHGVSKNILPDNDYTKWPKKYELWQFFRSLFKANLQVLLNADGSPSITPVLH